MVKRGDVRGVSRGGLGGIVGRATTWRKGGS